MLGPACVGEKAAGSGHSTPRAENMGATAADEDDDDVVGGGDVVVELGIIVHHLFRLKWIEMAGRQRQ